MRGQNSGHNFGFDFGEDGGDRSALIGEFGFHLIADGGAKPWRVRLRSPSLVLLQSFAKLCEGVYLADLIAILASIDPVLGDVDR